MKLGELYFDIAARTEKFSRNLDEARRRAIQAATGIQAALNKGADAADLLFTELNRKIQLTGIDDYTRKFRELKFMAEDLYAANEKWRRSVSDVHGITSVEDTSKYKRNLAAIHEWQQAQTWELERRYWSAIDMAQEEATREYLQREQNKVAAIEKLRKYETESVKNAILTENALHEKATKEAAIQKIAAEKKASQAILSEIDRRINTYASLSTNSTKKIQAEYIKAMTTFDKKTGIGGVFTVPQGVEGIGKSVEKANKHIVKMQEELTWADRLFLRLSRTVAAFALISSGLYALNVFKNLVQAGFDYNKTLEASQVSIASIITAQSEITNQEGKILEGRDKINAALQISADVYRQLEQDNLRTIATLPQLIKAFQSAIAPGLSVGFSIEQIRQYTLAMVQAASAMNVPLDMMAEELRSLLKGTITPRNTIIATYLGITNENIRQYKGDAQGLFNFVMQKLEAFTHFGGIMASTWEGLWSNVQDVFSKGMGIGTRDFFEQVKITVRELYEYIGKVDEKTGRMEFNPRFLEAMKGINTMLRGMLILITVIAKAFDNLFVGIGRLQQQVENYKNNQGNKDYYGPFRQANRDALNKLIVNSGLAWVQFQLGKLLKKPGEELVWFKSKALQATASATLLAKDGIGGIANAAQGFPTRPQISVFINEFSKDLDELIDKLEKSIPALEGELRDVTLGTNWEKDLAKIRIKYKEIFDEIKSDRDRLNSVDESRLSALEREQRATQMSKINKAEALATMAYSTELETNEYRKQTEEIDKQIQLLQTKMGLEQTTVELSREQLRAMHSNYEYFKKYSSLAISLAEKYRVPTDFALSVITAESGWRPSATSPEGAMGLMQIMPDTAKDLGLALENAYDPLQNLDAGMRYLRQLLDRFNEDTTLAAAAYNAGPNRKSLAEGRIPAIAETQEYVRLVSMYKKAFAEANYAENASAKEMLNLYDQLIASLQTRRDLALSDPTLINPKQRKQTELEYEQQIKQVEIDRLRLEQEIGDVKIEEQRKSAEAAKTALEKITKKQKQQLSDEISALQSILQSTALYEGERQAIYEQMHNRRLELIEIEKNAKIAEGVSSEIADKEYNIKKQESLNELAQFHLDKLQEMLENEKITLERREEIWSQIHEKIKKGEADVIQSIILGWQDAVEHFNKATQDMYEIGDEAANGIRDGFKSLFSSAIKGDWNDLQSWWDSFCDKMIDKWSEMLANMLMEAINWKSMMSSIMSALNFLPGIGGLFGGGGGGYEPNWSNTFANMFHSGGTVGYSPATARSVNPMLFAGAPRLHSGLNWDEYPAILKKGENVTPVGNGSPKTQINVNITNKHPSAKISSETDGQGNLNLVVEQLEQSISSRMNRGTGLAPYFDGRYRRRM